MHYQQQRVGYLTTYESLYGPTTDHDMFAIRRTKTFTELTVVADVPPPSPCSFVRGAEAFRWRLDVAASGLAIKHEFDTGERSPNS